MKQLRNLLLARSAWFDERLYGSAERDGYGYITPAMNRLFALFVQRRLEPASLPELARSLAVSRQALHQTVTEACRHGLVELVAHPTHRKMKLVRYTGKGLKMHHDATRELLQIEKELGARIGFANMEALREILDRAW